MRTNRVEVYDTNGKLVCWYTDNNERNLEGFIKSIHKDLTYKVVRYVG